MVSASAVLILLDSLLISQPFQAGGSLADDLSLAFEIAKKNFGPDRSVSDHAFNVISKRIDNPKRFKNKCDLILSHRYVLVAQNLQNKNETVSLTKIRYFLSSTLDLPNMKYT